MKALDKINSVNEKNLLLILFITAFVIRLFYIYFTYDPNFINEGDNLQYLTFAEEIIDQGIFVPNLEVKNDTAGWWGILGPGYPLIIAFFIILFGKTFFPVFIFNAILTALTVIVLYNLSKELTKNSIVSISVALWGVFYINYLKYTPYLLKESVVYLLLPLVILLIIREVNSRERITKSIIFAVLTYTYLIHTDERYFTYFPFLTVPYLFHVKKNPSLYSIKIAIWIFGVLLLMVPWLIRNYQVYDQFVLLTERTTKITALFGAEKIENQAEIMNYSSNLSRQEYDTVIDSLKNGYEVTSITDKELKSIKWGLQNGLTPYKYSTFEIYFYGFIDFWRPFYFSPNYINDGFRPQQWSLSHNFVSILFYGIFLPFYFTGIIYLIYKRNNLLLLFLVLLPFVQTFIHIVVGNVLERYRNPVDFIVVIVGLWFLIEILLKINNITSRVK